MVDSVTSHNCIDTHFVKIVFDSVLFRSPQAESFEWSSFILSIAGTGIAGYFGYMFANRTSANSVKAAKASLKSELDMHVNSIDARLNQIIKNKSIDAGEIMAAIDLITSLSSKVFLVNTKEIFQAGYEFSLMINLYYTELENLKAGYIEARKTSTLHAPELWKKLESLLQKLDYIQRMYLSWPWKRILAIKYKQHESQMMQKYHHITDFINGNSQFADGYEEIIRGPKYGQFSSWNNILSLFE